MQALIWAVALIGHPNSCPAVSFSFCISLTFFLQHCQHLEPVLVTFPWSKVACHSLRNPIVPFGSGVYREADVILVRMLPTTSSYNICCCLQCFQLDDGVDIWDYSLNIKHTMSIGINLDATLRQFICLLSFHLLWVFLCSKGNNAQ